MAAEDAGGAAYINPALIDSAVAALAFHRHIARAKTLELASVDVHAVECTAGGRCLLVGFHD